MFQEFQFDDSTDEPVVINSEVQFDESPEFNPAEFKLCPIHPLLGGQGFFELRPYQEECVEAIYADLQHHQSTMVVMATGTGKTVAALAEVAMRWPDELGRVLIIAHTEELIDQAAEKVGIHLDETTGIEMGARRELPTAGIYGKKPKVLVASIQTLSRPNRRERIKDKIGLILYDEFHHAASKSARSVISHFIQKNPQTRIVGATATPMRGDKKALGDIAKSVAFEFGLSTAIEQGWLVDVEQKIVIVEGLDFTKCRTTAGDFNQDDVASLMMGGSSKIIEHDQEELTPLQIEQIQAQEKMVHAIVKPSIEEAAGRPTLVFCVTKAHAKITCEIFNRYIQYSAQIITDETPKEERKTILNKFRAGQFQFLINVNVLSEGYDSLVDVVVNAAPTKSISRYIQRVGRATRTLPGTIDECVTSAERKAAIAASGKPVATVLDFTGNAAEHKICTIVDVLGGEYQGDVIDAALAKLASGSTEVVSELLKKTKEELEEAKKRQQMEKEERERQAKERAEREREERRIEAAKREKIRAEVQYRTETVNLKGAVIPEQIGVGMFRGGASDSQVKFLIRLGVSHENACKMTRGQAGAVIDKLANQTGGDFIVRFGKFAGNKLSMLPSAYLQWASKNMNDPAFQENYKKMIETRVVGANQ